MLVNLKVNGNPLEVEAAEDTTLLEVLREHLGLKGTRFGCGMEKCGACMVLVDGEPEYSCTRIVSTLEDHPIQTVEGLTDDHPLIASFVEHQAAQCGFCLPGIAMSALALLRRKPEPERDEVLAALEPHLCRCGAHQRIIDAILSVGAP